MKKGSSDAAYYDARYNGYSGKRRFEVEHPRHTGHLTIAAPDMNSAIVAAAQQWGEKWSTYGFACVEISKRLDGLRRYANECREENK